MALLVFLGIGLLAVICRFYIETKQIQVVEFKPDLKKHVNRHLSYKNSNQGKVMDHTKMKNLQPGNIKRVKEVVEAYKPSLTDFDYKFFGTVLEIEGRVLVHSLPKKMHTLEVTGGCCYIDGQQVQIHPDEVLKIARSVR